MSKPVDALKLARAFELDPAVGAILCEADGTLLYVNSAVRHVYGASSEPFVDRIGQRLDQFLPAPWVAERLAWFRKVLETERPLAVSHLFKGQIVAVTMYPLFDAHGMGRVLSLSRRGTPYDDDALAPEFAREETSFAELGPMSVLSPRELEVFVLLGSGLSTPDAAARLHRSPKTIERHKSAIGRKLGVSTMSAIAAFAARSGIDESHLKLRRIEIEFSAEEAPA